MIEVKNKNVVTNTVKVRETDNGTQIVLATELHQWLGVKTVFRTWIKRMVAYGFIENIDFWKIQTLHNTSLCRPKKYGKQNNRGGHNAKEFALSLDCAKSIAMLQRNEKGKQIRRYFIEVEKVFRVTATPTQVKSLYNRLQALEGNQINYREDWTIDRYLQVNGLYKSFNKAHRQQFGKQCTKAHKEQYNTPPKKVPHPSYINGQNVYPYELVNEVYNQIYKA